MHNYNSKRGSVYLVVLSTTVLVTSIALLGVESQRNSARVVDLAVATNRARSLSQSAFEIALQEISDTSGWRTKFTSGSSVVDLAEGNDRSRVILTDPVDNDLSDDAWEAVTLKSTGTSGDATQSFSVRLAPKPVADAALSYGIFAGGGIEFNSVTFSSNRAIYATGNVTANSSSVISGVGSAGTISGSTFSGSVRANLPVEAPCNISAIRLWQSLATPIRISDISSRQMRNIALGPGLNPYGSKIANAQGVYVIDCEGNSLTITNCRVVGTLIITNCSSLRFTGSVSIQAPSAAQPTLLVDGSAEIMTSNTDLNELTSLVNFNPAGVPNGNSTDIDVLDTYPSRINGLVYVSGTLVLGGTSRLIGVVAVGGDVKISSNVGISYTAAFATDPPLGFKTPGPLSVVSGSLIQYGR